MNMSLLHRSVNWNFGAKKKVCIPAVAPSQERELKPRRSHKCASCRSRRSFTGAWIETTFYKKYAASNGSLLHRSVNWNVSAGEIEQTYDVAPSQERELKLITILVKRWISRSLLHRSVNWNFFSSLKKESKKVAPSKERELKPLLRGRSTSVNVAPSQERELKQLCPTWNLPGNGSLLHRSVNWNLNL